RTLVEEADVGQKLHRRLAVLLHDALELDQVPSRVRVDRHVELAGGVLAGAQERLAARLDLGGVQHAAQAALRAAVVLAHEVHRLAQARLADGGVLLVGEAAPGVHVRLAVAKRRARVDAHAEVVDEAGVSLPVAAQAARVEDLVGLDHDAAALVDLVAPAVVRDDPAALDERLHAPTSSDGRPSYLMDNGCLDGPPEPPNAHRARGEPGPGSITPDARRL